MWLKVLNILLATATKKNSRLQEARTSIARALGVSLT